MDFQAIYRIDLRAVWRSKPWVWFTDLVAGLLQMPESLLWKALTAAKEGE